jgi:signal transduction histidine kinase
VLDRLRLPLRAKVAASFDRLRLPLRTKVSVFFGLLALVTTVSLSIVTHTFARTFMLDQRKIEAQQDAISNARDVLRQLRGTGPEEVTGWFQAEIQPTADDGFNYAQSGIDILAADVLAPEKFPPELKAVVAEGVAGLQRFSYEGELFLGVGIPLPEVDTDYFEAFPLDDTQEDLRILFFALAIGSTVITLLATAAGVWSSRSMLRPLERIARAAGKIAAGDLGTRVAAERDPDLVPIVDSFNGMADAVEARVEREVRFTSDVSHELRSPITALAAATDVLERRSVEFPERAQQAVGVIVSQVRRFDSMVLDLLELSRIDAGAADLHLETADIVELCRRIADHAGLTDLPIEIEPGAASHVRVDRVRFERILANLLDNARQHGNGPLRIAVEDAPRPFVDLVVEDAGPGVTDDERERIFERFARGKASRHRVGTGLGLALVDEHAAAHGGSAWVEDRPGGGARFVVRLPTASDPA